MNFTAQSMDFAAQSMDFTTQSMDFAAQSMDFTAKFSQRSQAGCSLDLFSNPISIYFS
jgi:hypothetical protein